MRDCLRRRRRPTSSGAGLGGLPEGSVPVPLEPAVLSRRRAAAALTPFADALLPLVAAAEVAYLAGLISHPAVPGRDRRARCTQERGARPDGRRPAPPSQRRDAARSAARTRARGSSGCARAAWRCAASPPPCAARPATGGVTEDIRTPALDRLLWVFLRLLVSKKALERFLQRPTSRRYPTRLEELRKSLRRAQAGQRRAHRPLAAGQRRDGELRIDNYSARRRTPSSSRSSSTASRTRSGAHRDGREPPGSRRPQQPDRRGRRRHAVRPRRPSASCSRSPAWPTSSRSRPSILETDLREVLPAVTPSPVPRSPPTARLASRRGPRSSPSCTSRARRRCSSCTATRSMSFRRRRRRDRGTALADFLAEQLFGRWDLVIHYDLARGLRAFAGSQRQRLQEMVALANRKVGDLRALPTRSDQGARRARSLRPEERDGRPRPTASASRVIIDHVGYVARAANRDASISPAYPPRDAAQLGVEPVRQAPQHGVRADRRAAVDAQRAAGRQPARRDDRGAAARRRASAPRSSPTTIAGRPCDQRSPTTARPSSAS